MMISSGPVRVLVVDDSDICRSALKHALQSDPGIVVVGEARDGIDAVKKVRELSPSLITMDLLMPRQGGLETIEQIMRLKPTPILVVTDRPRLEGVDMTFESLKRGAVDLISKATSWEPGSRDTAALVERVKQIWREGTPHPTLASAGVPVSGARPVAVVGIGASTGGPQAIAEILTRLPRSFPLPLLVVQHMDEQFHDGFVEWLKRLSPMPVAMVRDRSQLGAPGVWVAPQGKELVVDRTRMLRLMPAPAGRRHVPSADALFFSLADSHGSQAAGVLLTGMGADGAKGLKALREKGGLTVAQDRATSVIYGMPGAAVELGAAEHVLALSSVAPFLVDCARSATVNPATSAGAKKTILVLDDSLVVLDAVRHTLGDAGYDVIAVDNPLVLPSVIRRQPIDLALIDVNMPAVAGDIVTKIMVQAGVPGKKVVLFSDLEARELEVRAEACGALGFIKKQGGRQLLAEVERFLKLAAEP